jgi:hypothetical protein
MHDRPRRIEDAGLVSLNLLQQILKDLAEHFRVERDRDLGRRVLLNCKIVLIEEAENTLVAVRIEEFVLDQEQFLIITAFLEEAAIQVWNRSKS